MKKLVFYDMDNTIAEMHKKLTGIYSGRVKNYDPVNEEEDFQMKEKLAEDGFFQDLTVIQRANSVLKKLIKNGYDVRILSQPMPRDSSIDEKNYWLNKYFPFIPRYNRIFTFDKWLLAREGRVLVDDNPSHLITWQQYGGTAICFKRGYNKDYQGITIKHHQEIFQLLEELEKGGRS